VRLKQIIGVTADTITDEQIRELLDHAQGRLNAGDFGHGDEDVVVACERALRLHAPEDDEDREEYEALYETSRARCADLLNARTSVPK
jgi:hypothetical protein